MNGGSAPSNSESVLKKKKSSRVTQVDRDARARLELDIQQQEPSMVQLGDASIASPFTARRTSIDVILTILRTGRCTLVTSIQVYKVLALNCLVSAYMMSALFLSGLKVGDIQMTAQGLMTASLFFALSQAKPLTNLSSFRPPSTVFAKSVLFSIIGQVLTHLGCIVIIMQLATKHVNLNDPSLSPDGKFRPNIVNSSLFLLSLIIQVNSFITNYRGHPFTMKLTDHALLFRTAILIYFAVVLLVGQQFQPLNDFLQLVPFPDSAYQGQLLSVFLGDFVLCYGIEMSCRRMENNI
jgi:cation-transporting ATPase 13A1